MRKTNKLLVLLTLAALTTLAPSAQSQKVVAGQPNVEQERSQALLMNLKSGPRSAGFFILHSIRESDEMSRDLDKALKQIEAVDATYAKARTRPDDRYLSSTCLRLTAARQTADQLKSQLEDTWDELKGSIKQTLVSDPNFKP
jgi:hypothetical protein